MATPPPRGGKKGGKPGGKPEKIKLADATIAAARALGASYEELDDPRLLALLATVEAIRRATPATNLITEIRAALARHRNRPAPTPRDPAPRAPLPATIALAMTVGATLVEANLAAFRALLLTAEDAVAATPSLDLRSLLARAILDLRKQAAQDAVTAQATADREQLKLQSDMLTAQAKVGDTRNRAQQQSGDMLDKFLGWVVWVIVVGVIFVGLYSAMTRGR